MKYYKGYENKHGISMPFSNKKFTQPLIRLKNYSLGDDIYPQQEAKIYSSFEEGLMEAKESNILLLEHEFSTKSGAYKTRGNLLSHLQHFELSQASRIKNDDLKKSIYQIISNLFDTMQEYSGNSITFKNLNSKFMTSFLLKKNNTWAKDNLISLQKTLEKNTSEWSQNKTCYIQYLAYRALLLNDFDFFKTLINYDDIETKEQIGTKLIQLNIDEMDINFLEKVLKSSELKGAILEKTGLYTEVCLLDFYLNDPTWSTDVLLSKSPENAKRLKEEKINQTLEKNVIKNNKGLRF